MSMEGCLGAGPLGAGFAGEGGREICLVGMDDVDAVLECVALKGFGAANFVKSLLTFPVFWLGFFCRGGGAFRVVFGFDEISRAAICRVTDPTEVILEEMQEVSREVSLSCWTNDGRRVRLGELEHEAEQEDKRPNTGVFLRD